MATYKSVLIVDDDPTQIAILTAYFAGRNVSNIQGACDPIKALEIIGQASGRIDLIVSDLQMPQMDGLEFMRHLKDMGFGGHVALVSGVQHGLLDHASRLAKMHNLQLIGHINKPLTKFALDETFAKNTGIADADPEKANIAVSPEDFSKALSAYEIVPYYQPKIDLKTRKVAGAEALARWNKPGFGFIPPEVFVGYAEKNGRIEELTFHLYKQVLNDLTLFVRQDQNQKVAINLSPDLMSNIGLPDTLNRMMLDVGLSPDNVSFEVTENSILNLDPVTLEVLSRLRILNFDLAIDDFGTGSSNVKTLRDFPFSELKIDRSFISDSTKNTFSRETAQAAVMLAHEQGMRVVAEGIEDRETWDFVCSQGIEQAQGYFMAKAMCAEDYLNYIATHHAGLEVGRLSNVA